MRTNGFAWPLHPFQVTSFFLFSGFVAGFHAFFQPALPKDWVRWFWVAIFDVATLCLIYFAGKATSCDPRDPSCNPQGRALFANEDKETRERRRNMIFPGKEWCQYCLEHVHPHSKHCRACDKCVDIFDHHCKWLNNCIGRANYTSFFLSLVSVAFLLTVQAGIGIWILVRTAIDENGPETQRILRELGGFSLTKIRIVISIYVAVLLLVDMGILQLMKFHMFLYYHNLTTYEWIVYQRRVAEARRSGHPDPPIPTGTEPIKLRIQRQARLEKLEAQQRALAQAQVTSADQSHPTATTSNSTSCHFGPLMCGPCPSWCCLPCCERDETLDASSPTALTQVQVINGGTSNTTSGAAASSTVPTPFTVSVLSTRVTPAPPNSVHAVFDLERHDMLELAPVPPRVAPHPHPPTRPIAPTSASAQENPHALTLLEAKSALATEDETAPITHSHNGVYQSSGLLPAATPIKMHIPSNVLVGTPGTATDDQSVGSPVRPFPGVPTSSPHLETKSPLPIPNIVSPPKAQPGRYNPAAANAAAAASVNVTRNIVGTSTTHDDDARGDSESVAGSDLSESQVQSVQGSEHFSSPQPTPRNPQVSGEDPSVSHPALTSLPTSQPLDPPRFSMTSQPPVRIHAALQNESTSPAATTPQITGLKSHGNTSLVSLNPNPSSAASLNSSSNSNAETRTDQQPLVIGPVRLPPIQNR